MIFRDSVCAKLGRFLLHNIPDYFTNSEIQIESIREMGEGSCCLLISNSKWSCFAGTIEYEKYSVVVTVDERRAYNQIRLPILFYICGNGQTSSVIRCIIVHIIKKILLNKLPNSPSLSLSFLSLIISLLLVCLFLLHV